MCLAIPMQVTAITNEDFVECRIGEGTTAVQASTALLPEAVSIGDYIIVHAGFAIKKLEEKDALETLKLLREMAESIPQDCHL